ncbi:hypothetical protein L6164_028977 [Bauhinia variegata]|uniref:Uncharacterized protein n=1 Tax=Bauhinia variegata TaxID=167791 RepID=A0ACB9L7A9_BAUVA|nr:hypothetical protein L6164_028977 [Bauhinia variegata]
MRELYLNFNNLSGNIPKEIKNLTLLTTLYLDHNFFKGTIPKEIGNLSMLIDIRIGHNGFHGGEESMTQTMTLATIGYMAPEYGSEGVISTRSDAFSFGSNLEDSLNVLNSSETSQAAPIKTKKLFVTGLSFYTSEKTLRAAFEGFGDIVEVKVIMDKISKRSKGYAFVEYTTEEAASAALKEMNGKVDSLISAMSAYTVCFWTV